MKRIFSIHNIFLMLVVTLITVLSLNLKEVKAAGAVTWDGPNSITIRNTINKAMNPMDVSLTYVIEADDNNPSGASGAPTNVTAAFTRTSPTVSNYTLTKTASLDFSNMTFTKPGDYAYKIGLDLSEASGDHGFWISPDSNSTIDGAQYRVIVSVRNSVNDANVPTGNFSASLILQAAEYNSQTGQMDFVKVDAESGVLYADYGFHTEMTSLAVVKNVTGIGADTTEYFPFTISLNDDLDIFNGWVVPIEIIDYSNGTETDVTNVSVTYSGQTKTQPTSITIGGSSVVVYLKHMQAAVIGVIFDENTGEPLIEGIPYFLGCDLDEETGSGVARQNYKFESAKIKRLNEASWNSKNKSIPLLAIDPSSGSECYGTRWSVQEASGDYTVSVKYNGSSLEDDYFSDMPVGRDNDAAQFTNNKEMSPVTGVIFTILPYLILIGIGIGGTLLVLHLRKEHRKVQE